MKLTDIIALAKKGYSPTDIKDLLALANEDTPNGDKPAETGQKDAPQPEPEKPAAPSAQEESEGPEADDHTAELQKEIDDLKAQLAAAQTANSRKDNSGNVPETGPDINDIVRRFM